ncbi:hypothetical protein OAU50_05775, partial [Planctomycetota bacterium]|nr:hypothetical protein [Planctomycetota bacterium]
VVVGGLIAGYINRDLPIVGPAVTWLVGTASSGLDKTGEYEVVIDNLVLNPGEFEKGENVDLRVIVTQFNAAGKEVMEWDSEDYGDVDREAGKDSMTADWKHTPIKQIMWREGDKFVVKIQDGGEELCHWMTNPKAKEFALGGKHKFDLVRGKPERRGVPNEITFSAKRVGDLPPAK